MARSLCCLSVLVFALVVSAAFAAEPPAAQRPELAMNEAMAIYLGNLKRRADNQGPLRANRQLTGAARWFAWDSVENRPDPFCGHTDTQGHTAAYRAQAYGYRGHAGAENAFCAFLSAEDAVNGWMNSPPHRVNLLSATPRETGLGYYRRDSDGRGYVVQMFGDDPDYAPVVINNEAPSTASAQITLYAYNRVDNATFAGIGAARLMRIGTDACFSGAAWLPFTTEQPWSLAPGSGWRTLYVQTRDKMNRTATASDSIYLGSGAPPAELSLDQQSTTADSVKIYNLNGGALSQVQFSPGWIVDDTFSSFERLSGAGGRVSDPAALGGSAFQLGPGQASSAWVWASDFVKNVPLVAYFRLKVDDNTSGAEIASFTIAGGGQTYGPLSLRGSDFTAAGAYQEFALPFTFNDNPNDGFLIFNFARSGGASLYIDAISIFTPPQPISGPTLVWPFPGGNYRGQGIQLRYSDAAGHFTAATEAQTTPDGIQAEADSQVLIAERDSPRHPHSVLTLAADCLGTAQLAAHSSAGWLQAHLSGNQLLIDANQAGLAPGRYTATITVDAPGIESVAPARVAVTLQVVEHLSIVFAPRAAR